MDAEEGKGKERVYELGKGNLARKKNRRGTQVTINKTEKGSQVKRNRRTLRKWETGNNW